MVYLTTLQQNIFVSRSFKRKLEYKTIIFKKVKMEFGFTNWDSKFGGKALEICSEFDEYYLHLYDEKQVDLNWEKEEVRNELIKISELG